MEECAKQLDERASSLRQLGQRHKANGVFWGVFSTAAGLALTPFTGIKTYSILFSEYCMEFLFCV
jgi:hypothetical protein